MYRALLIAAFMLPAFAAAAERGPQPADPGGANRKLPVAADLSGEAGVPEGEWPSVIPPEVATRIRLSSSDLNRISCPSEIRDALTSTEKGVVIKITGKDAFVKFKVTKRGDKLVYATTPTELYVVCGDETYSMVALPQRIPSQTVRLSSGKEKKIKDNAALYAGLPFEKAMLKAIQDVYTEQIPDSYTVTRKERRFDSFRELRLALTRVVEVEGEGLRIKEYLVSPREGIKEFRMNEKMLIRPELAENPVAVSIERHILRPGDTTRAFVVEQRGERQGFSRKLESDLPVVDDAGKGDKTAPAKGGEKNMPDRREASDEK